EELGASDQEQCRRVEERQDQEQDGVHGIARAHHHRCGGEQHDREDIEEDVRDHRYGASSSSRWAISASQRSPLSSSFCLSYSSSSRVSAANSKLGPSTMASTGQASSHNPQ